MSVSPDETAIRELIDTWMHASMAGDTPAVLDLMTDDVIFMVPGQDPFGKMMFAAASNAMQGVKLEGKSHVRELEILGDWAYARCYLEVTMMPPGKPPVTRRGYTLSIFRKGDDGRWRLARDANLMTKVE
jgi:uncharacterized protein (TIGR02246 family)